MMESKKGEEEMSEVLMWILKVIGFAILIVGVYFLAKRVGAI